MGNASYTKKGILMPPELDRRIKIQKSEHPRIKLLHAQGVAIRAIAREYGVDKRLIQFILFPERQKVMYQARVARGGSMQYYDKNKWREVMKEHRHYKSTVFGKNKKDYGYNL
jgi:hypothetical protein